MNRRISMCYLCRPMLTRCGRVPGHGEPSDQHGHYAEGDRGTTNKTVHLPHAAGHEVTV